MSLALLFNDQVAAPAGGSTDPVVSFLLETTPGVWADLSAGLKSYNLTRGRQEELNEFQPGVVDLVLEQTPTRTYDPKNPAGPYYGYLKPMTAVQLLATYGGVTYPRMAGTVDSWNRRSTGPYTGQVEVAFTDASKILAAAELASSAYAQEVRADSPAHWWRMGDAVGSTTATDSGAEPVAGVLEGTTATFGQPGYVSRDDNGAVLVAGTAQFTLATPGLDAGQTTYTIEAIVQATQTFPTSNGYVYSQGDIDLRLQLQPISPRFTSHGLQSTTLYTDLEAHHVVLTRSGSNVALYVDGVLEASGTTSDLPPAGPATVARATPDQSFYVAEVALYDQALSAGRVAEHYLAMSTPWNNDSPRERIDRVLDTISFPDALRDLDEGTSVLQSAELAMSVLEHATRVAASDFGELYVTAAGVVRFVSREGLLNRPVHATFSDDGIAMGFVDAGDDYSDRLIRNDVTVSRAEGVAQNVRDETSIAQNLRHSYVLDGLYHDSDDLSRAAAQFILSEYAQPLSRIGTFTLAPRSADHARLFPAVLGADLLDAVEVTQTPQGVPPAETGTYRLEGISESWAPKFWTTTWALSPAYAAGPFWQIGVPGFSEIGQTTRVYF